MTRSWQTSNEWEPISLNKLQVGDELVYHDWRDTDLHNSGYTIIRITQNTIFASHRFSKEGGPTVYPSNTFARGWWRKINEIPYDPAQQPDEEDDI